MRQRLLLWLILLFACGLRVVGLGAESLWYDEAYSATLARVDWGAAWQMMAADLNPPLHSLFLRASVLVFGSSEFAVRFVSVFLGVLLVPLMWVLARRLFGGTTAWIAAALVSLSPLFVWYAREARSYGQATTLGLAAAYALVRAQSEARGHQPRWWIAFVAFALGAVYSHYLALYLIAALGVFWLTQIRFRISNFKSEKGWGTIAFGWVVLGILVSLPRILDLTLSSHIYWPGQLDVPSALIGMARAMVVWRVDMPVLADALVILCGIVALIAVLHAASSPAERRGVLLACLVVLVGMALMLAGIYRRPKFEPRYSITLAPFAWLLVAAGIRVLSSKYAWAGKLAAALTAAALLGGLATSSLIVLAGAFPRDDWRGAVAYLRQTMQPAETIVLVSGHAFPALAYYDAPAWVALPNDPVLDVTHILDYGNVAPVLNRIQNGSRGVWLLLWQDEIVDPTEIVPTLLGDIGTELPVEAEFAGLRLRHFVLDHPTQFPLEPLMTSRLNRSPLKGLTALGFMLEPQPLPADVPLAVRMFWRADVEVRGVAGGSLRILDEQGNEWMRRDELLGGSLYSERWPLNEWVMRQYTVSLPSGAPPGLYHLKQIVYRGEENGELDLGTFVVTRPVRAPDLAALGVAPNGLARWGELSLLSVALDQKTVEPCEPLNFSALWRAETRPGVDYKLRVVFGKQSSDQPLTPDWPTPQWQPGDVWRTWHHMEVACRALDGMDELRLALVDSSGQLVAAPLDAGSVKIQSGRVFTPPAIRHPFVADLGGQVRLLGYDYKTQISSLKPQIDLTLYWQAMREMTQSLTVMTHVEGDRLWGQHDGLPAQGLKPTERWVTNEIVADRHVITLDPATPPGKYRLVIGLYDSVSLVRVPTFDADGRRWPDDGIVLQDILVNK